MTKGLYNYELQVVGSDLQNGRNVFCSNIRSIFKLNIVYLTAHTDSKPGKNRGSIYCLGTRARAQVTR